MKLLMGDYIVVSISIVISIAYVLDYIRLQGFDSVGYAVGAFMILMSFVIYTFIGYILLFAFRQFRDTIWYKRQATE